MGRTTGLLISFTKCNATANEADWSAWYDEVHLPDLLRDDGGPWVATRWQVVPKPTLGMPGLGFTHLAIYEFEGTSILHQVERLIARDIRLHREGRIHANHAVLDAQVFHAHGAHTDKPAPSAELRGHIMAYVMCNQPDVEAEWDEWYDREHVPDMMSSGGFSAATRWEREPRNPFGTNHITLYDVAHESVQTAVDLSAAVMPGLIAAGRKHRCHTGGLVLTLEPTGRYGGAGLRAADVD